MPVATRQTLILYRKMMPFPSMPRPFHPISRLSQGMLSFNFIRNYMIKQNIEKIGKLLRDRSYCVPELLYKYYAFFNYFAHRIDSEGAEFNAIALFSDIYKLYKSYLIDEPYQLTKLSLNKIDEGLKDQSLDCLADFAKFRDKFLKEFANLNPKEEYLRVMLQQVSDLSWATRLKDSLNESLETKKSVDSKKKVESIKHSELTLLCWFRQFKGDYLIHISTFIEYFHTIVQQIFPYLSFINRHSNQYLKELCDPDRKYFITIMNVEEMLFKLRDPLILQRLKQESQEHQEEEAFKAERLLSLSLASSSLNTLEKLELNGELIKHDSVERAVQTKPVIFVGSAADNDIVIKSKYVSRKQVMIIEDRKAEKTKEKDEPQFFSVVCLSQTNFTSVKYPRVFKLHIGDIFYCEGVKYQVIKLQKESLEVPPEEEDERTLTILPTEREWPVNAPLSCEKMSFLILSGEDKEKELSLSSQHLHKLTEMDEKHEYRLSRQLIHEDHFYLRPGNRVLLKNANEILENRLSRKIRLVRGMEIILEEYSLIVQ